MNARRIIAGFVGFASLFIVLSTLPAHAQALQGPFCLQSQSTASKSVLYRIYWINSNEGSAAHYAVSGDVTVRTTPGSSQVTRYPMVGGGFTQSGGAIWLGVSIAWINTAVPSAEPFHTLLYVNSLTPGSTGSGISEDVFGSMTNYTATPVNCPAS